MGKLSFDGKHFRFVADSRDESELARDSGFRQTGDSLRWETRHTQKANRLRAYADSSVEKKFKNYFITKTVSPDHLQWRAGKTPKKFQLESARHILTRTPAYCADEAGLGKTITSAIVIGTEALPRTLIICPPYLKYNWAYELNAWISGRSVFIAEKAADWASIKRHEIDVLIVPDSLIEKPTMRAKLLTTPFHRLIVDEVHRFKDPKSKRTIALFGNEDEAGIIERADRIAYLSGTPTPNGRPMEIYPMLEASAHGVIDGMGEKEFGRRFCAGKKVTIWKGRRPEMVWDFTGKSNLKELRGKLRKSFMIRHLKRDVLKELEPKTRRMIFLDTPKKVQAYERRALINHSLTDLLGDGYGLGDVARYRKECGLAKLKPCVDIIRDLLESRAGKVVVFAHHIEVVEGLVSALKEFNPLMVRGGINAKEKQNRVTLFQTKKKYRLIIGNIDSMGVGVTLTKARTAVVVEPSWVPGINEQAEDRIHRITQDDYVDIIYPVLRNSLDERQLVSVMEKQKGNKELYE